MPIYNKKNRHVYKKAAYLIYYYLHKTMNSIYYLKSKPNIKLKFDTLLTLTTNTFQNVKSSLTLIKFVAQGMKNCHVHQHKIR